MLTPAKTTLLIMCLISCFAKAYAAQYSGINRVSFNQPEYDNTFAGNGFLLEYRDEIYAVTAKHILFEARVPDMETVSIDGYVRQWQIHPLLQPEKFILLGELLNASQDTPLDMAILRQDWLVFRVKENHSDITPVRIRTRPIEPGEILTAYGCTYANASSCQQDTYEGEMIANEEANLRIAMPGLEPATLRGLSGSPVLDENHQLVGIVSNVIRSRDNRGFDFAPANLSYLLEVLSQFETVESNTQ